MPTVTRKECWDLLEDKLRGMAETRCIPYYNEASLAIAIVISAGRDNDLSFLESSAFAAYCQLARLQPYYVKKLIAVTHKFLDVEGPKEFKKRIINGFI